MNASFNHAVENQILSLLEEYVVETHHGLTPHELSLLEFLNWLRMREDKDLDDQSDTTALDKVMDRDSWQGSLDKLGGLNE